MKQTKKKGAMTALIDEAHNSVSWLAFYYGIVANDSGYWDEISEDMKRGTER
jgi:hypothetical protein